MIKIIKSLNKKKAFLKVDENILPFSYILKKATNLSEKFKGQGIEPEMIIAIDIEDPLHFTTALFATIISGAVPTIFDVTSKNMRLILKEAGYPIVTPDFNINFPDNFNIKTSRIKEHGKYVPRRDGLFLFTSGTTGKPVRIYKDSFNIMEELLILQKIIPLTKNTIFLSTVRPHHIYGFLFTILLPLFTDTPVIHTKSLLPGNILHIMDKNNYNICLITIPAFIKALLRVSKNNNHHNIPLTISSSAPLQKVDAISMNNILSDSIIEIFGSTETGGIALRQTTHGKRDDSWQVFPGIQYKIQDDRLMIRSRMVSPDQTIDSDGFYTTMDIARRLDNERFEILGRIQHIVKIGGKRVSTLEIEKCIMDSGLIKECAVIGVKSKKMTGEILVAFLSGVADYKKIKQYLIDRLDLYKIPTRFICLENLPKTGVNKKINISVLKEIIG